MTKETLIGVPMNVVTFIFLKISPLITEEELRSLSADPHLTARSQLLFNQSKDEALKNIRGKPNLVHAIDSVSDLRQLFLAGYLPLDEKIELLKALQTMPEFEQSNKTSVAIKSTKAAIIAKLATAPILPERMAAAAAMGVGLGAMAMAYMNPGSSKTRLEQLIHRREHLETLLAGATELEAYSYLSVLREMPHFGDMAITLARREEGLHDVSENFADYATNSAFMPPREIVLCALPEIIKDSSNKLISWIYKTGESTNQIGYAANLVLLEKKLLEFFDTMVTMPSSDTKQDASSILSSIGQMLNPSRWMDNEAFNENHLAAALSTFSSDSDTAEQANPQETLINTPEFQHEVLEKIKQFSKALEAANLMIIKISKSGEPVDQSHAGIIKSNAAIWKSALELYQCVNKIDPTQICALLETIERYIPNSSRPSFIHAIPKTSTPTLAGAEEAPLTLAKTLIKSIDSEIEKILARRADPLKGHFISEERHSHLLKTLNKIKIFLQDPANDGFEAQCYYLTKKACEQELCPASEFLAGATQAGIGLFANKKLVYSKSSEALAQAIDPKDFGIELNEASSPEKKTFEQLIAQELLKKDLDIGTLIEKYGNEFDKVLQASPDFTSASVYRK
jgi:hypothetical protein